MGLCSAAVDATFNGFSQDIIAGPQCWLVAVSFCSGVV
jgi:hypothetical protein